MTSLVQLKCIGSQKWQQVGESGRGPPPSHSFISTVLTRARKRALPARASEQGNVIGLVSVYIYIYNRKNHLLVNEKRRCRDGPSAGENSGDSA